MNCRTFAKRMYDYQDGTLAAPEKAEFELHRSGCRECAARLESESQTAELVRTAVLDACDGLDFSFSSRGISAQPARRKHSRSSPVAGWQIAAAVAALLIMALLVLPIVRRTVPERADAWSQEIQVRYEGGLRDETTLISHDSGTSAIIEIQVCYYTSESNRRPR